MEVRQSVLLESVDDRQDAWLVDELGLRDG